MILWYYVIMITTNVRLSEKDYQKYRLIALKKKKSFAQLVREALDRIDWHLEDYKAAEKSRRAALSILKEKGFKSNLSIREMIEEGRKY